MTPRLASRLYDVCVGLVVVFQAALAAGAPWGEWAMGGAVKGAYPPALRVAAVVQAALLVGTAAVVAARARVRWPSAFALSKVLIWPVVALLAVSLVLNLITPSANERLIWAPVMLVSAARVARS